MCGQFSVGRGRRLIHSKYNDLNAFAWFRRWGGRLWRHKNHYKCMDSMHFHCVGNGVWGARAAPDSLKIQRFLRVGGSGCPRIIEIDKFLFILLCGQLGGGAWVASASLKIKRKIKPLRGFSGGVGGTGGPRIFENLQICIQFLCGQWDGGPRAAPELLRTQGFHTFAWFRWWGGRPWRPKNH